MADRMLDLMLKLDAVRGISGYEEEVAELMHAELAPLSDEQTSDPLGNHYFTKRGAKGAPVLMLCAHMDEIGFLVQHIEDEGFVRLARRRLPRRPHAHRPGARGAGRERAGDRGRRHEARPHRSARRRRPRRSRCARCSSTSAPPIVTRPRRSECGSAIRSRSSARACSSTGRACSPARRSTTVRAAP